MDREEKIKLIESYHKSLGYQSWLPFYLDNCNTGISLDTISDDELQKILLFMEDEIATLKNMIEERKQEIYRYMIGNIILSNCDIDKYEVTI